jgi:hypothetical protein
MHILYIHQYFTTPLGITGTRSYEFARRWVAQGHKVTMLTSTAALTSKDLAQARRFRRKKNVFEARDQWPESVVEVGVIKNRFLIRILLWFERLIYKNASATVAVSDGMAEGIREAIKVMEFIKDKAELWLLGKWISEEFEEELRLRLAKKGREFVESRSF